MKVKNKIYKFLSYIMIVCTISSPMQVFSQENNENKEYYIESPYNVKNQYQYKISQHNHSKYTTNYDHAKMTPKEIFEEYKNRGYASLAITDHSRITTPDNTIPKGNDESGWAVDNMTWIPGIEQWIGDRNGTYGNIYGEASVINVSTDKVSEINKNELYYENEENYAWILDKNDKKTYYTKQVDAKNAFYPLDPRQNPAFAQFTFEGTGVAWIANKNNYGGKVDIYVDDKLIEVVDLYSEKILSRQEVFRKNNLSLGKHTIKIVLRDEDARSGFYNQINVYSFDVYNKENKLSVYGKDVDKITYGPDYYKHQFQHELYSPKEILETYSKDGAFVTLNHPKARRSNPEWADSGWTKDELDIVFSDLERYYMPNAVEIGNASYDFSDVTSYKNAEEEWDYLLSKGYKIWGVASDDAHKLDDIGYGWNVIYTDASSVSKLNKDIIMDSLFKGDFYASQGPMINKCIVENNKNIKISVDKPSRIEFIIKDGVVAKTVKDVTEASYKVQGSEGYVRVKVTREDENWESIGGGIGKSRSAWTNPFFIVSPYKIDIQGDTIVNIPNSGENEVLYKSVVKYMGNIVYEDVTWEVSGNKSSISIDKYGILKISDKAVEQEITLTARLKEDDSVIGILRINLEKTIDNTINVEKIGLNNNKIMLNTGDEKLLLATISPNNASNRNIIWSTSNKNIATVDKNGKVKGINEGKATIKAKTEDGGYEDTCDVVVYSIDSVLPKQYMVVNDTLIDLDYIIQKPEVLIDELNKYSSPKVYMSTSLNDVIKNGNSVGAINRIIDKEYPNGKEVFIMKLDVTYKKIINNVGLFSVRIKSNLQNASYFSLNDENGNKVDVKEYSSISSSIGEITIYLFDKDKNLIGSGVIQKTPENQIIIIDMK